MAEGEDTFPFYIRDHRRDRCKESYEFGKVLGRGTFAEVIEARRVDEDPPGTFPWAVKKIDKKKLEPEDEEALQVEVEILETLEHPNIVHLAQVFDCKHTFYMVMEKLVGGELFDRIVEKTKYTEYEAKMAVKEVASGLQYCHELGVVHRDLKPENLLYTTTAPDAQLKIADFGLGKLLSDNDMMATACGTPGYVAPEILRGRKYTACVDCWSLGVIAYILLCGFPPFYDENTAVLFRLIKRGDYDFPSPYWDAVSAQAKDFISGLLVVDPARRMTIDQVLRHPWLASAAPAGAVPTPQGEEEHAELSGAQAKIKKMMDLRRRLRKIRLAARTIVKFRRLTGATAADTAPAADKLAQASQEAAAEASGDEAEAAGGGGGAE